MLDVCLRDFVVCVAAWFSCGCLLADSFVLVFKAVRYVCFSYGCVGL